MVVGRKETKCGGAKHESKGHAKRTWKRVPRFCFLVLLAFSFKLKRVSNPNDIASARLCECVGDWFRG